jgi:hypothetical protein
MAPRDNLLKEAIADAKMVRDAAIANARIQIEEAFAPHMDSLLSKKLRNALNEDNDGSSEIAGGKVTVDNPGPKEPSKTASDSSHIENKGLESAPMGEAFGKDDEVEFDPTNDAAGVPSAGGTPGAAPAAAPIAAPAPAPAADMGAPNDVGAPGAGAQAGGVQDDILDLEAIIRELELDVGGDASMAPAAAAPTGAPAPEVHEEGFEDPNCGAKVDGPITVRTESTNGANDKDGPALPEVEGVSGGKKVTPGQKVTQWEKDHETVETDEGQPKLAEELTLDEILREMESEEGEPVNESHAAIVSENAELKRSLRQHIEVIQFMKGKLHEVNMLNSKLLYTNRLFKNFDLNVNQKMKVVETFDRATTVREVKLVYTTLAESFNGRTVGGAKKTGASRIAEGMASKPMGSTKPQSDAAVAATKPSILAEGDAMVARMQKLAGINLKQS